MLKRRGMLKAVSLVLAVFMSIAVFSGCGKKASDRDEQGRIIAQIGGWPTQEGEKLDNINARKERFEAANPDVVIEPIPWTFDRKTFYAKAAGGQLPDYYAVQFTEIPEIINSEYSADLTDVLEKRGYDGKFNEAVLKAVSSEDGRVMAFPTSAYVLGLAYNVGLFEKAGLMEADGTPKQPKDWNEVVEFAVKIKEATGKPGIVLPTADRSGGWIFTSIAWSFGVDFMEKGEDGKWKATFNTPEAAAALQWYKDLKWKYDVLPANTLINGEEWYKSFALDEGAMMLTGGDYSARVLKYAMPIEKVGMMAMPAGPKRHVTLFGGDVRCVSNTATEDQADAIVRWIETEHSFDLTDEYKQNTEETVQKKLKDGQHVGIKGMSIWNTDTESVKWYNEYIDQNTNANPNHVRLYNEFVANCPVEIQPEEPVCCQELYAVLDNCIQEVLTDKNADCAKILEKANNDFQVNYLDNLTY